MATVLSCPLTVKVLLLLCLLAHPLSHACYHLVAPPRPAPPQLKLFGAHARRAQQIRTGKDEKAPNAHKLIPLLAECGAAAVTVRAPLACTAARVPVVR
jgi:hypothetical protein